MSDIRQRLISLDPLRDSHPTARHRSSRDRTDQRLGGESTITPFGECLVRQRTFSLDHHHGRLSLCSLLERNAQCLAFLSPDRDLQSIDFRKTLFLDIETTGLAGGTGTYAFLVGLGWYEDAALRVAQVFMKDYHEEQALLHEISSMAAPFSSLVTYNGKRFDIPLLRTRFIYSRMEDPLLGFSHFDLLYPVRRLWRLRLDNCTLGTVEREILGFARQNDVPGSLIPSLYFEYLQTGATTGIEHVFYHNLLDVLSLVTLASRVCQSVDSPFGTLSEDGLDLYSLGRLFGRGGHLEQCIQCYVGSLERRVPGEYQQEALRQLSHAYKRTGDWGKATELWYQVIEHGTEFQLYPYQELAKYFEHQARDYPRAISIVERALAAMTTISELRCSATLVEEMAALRHRLARLRRKQSGT